MDFFHEKYRKYVQDSIYIDSFVENSGLNCKIEQHVHFIFHLQVKIYSKNVCTFHIKNKIIHTRHIVMSTNGLLASLYSRKTRSSSCIDVRVQNLFANKCVHEPRTVRLKIRSWKSFANSHKPFVDTTNRHLILMEIYR